MSAFERKDIGDANLDVCQWPEADISFASIKRLYQHHSASPQDEGGMEVSKNGNKIAVVGGASRVGCAAMTVTAAAILTASTLLGQERN